MVVVMYAADAGGDARRGVGGNDGHACVASELSTEIVEMSTHSELLSALCDEPDREEIVAARELHSFTRGAVEVKVGQWIACEDVQSGESYFMRASELMQIFTHNSHSICMIGADCMQPPQAPAQGAWMSVSECAFTSERMILDVEDMVISQLHAVRDGDQYRFQYLW
jgi:hypothetical protein